MVRGLSAQAHWCRLGLSSRSDGIFTARTKALTVHVGGKDHLLGPGRAVIHTDGMVSVLLKQTTLGGYKGRRVMMDERMVGACERCLVRALRARSSRDD